jgi:hypothetical protein
MPRIAVLALAAALVLPSAAAGADDTPLQRAREAHLSSRPLPKLVFMADTVVRLSRAEWVAGQRPLVRLTNAGHTTIAVRLPAVFTRTAASGLRFTSATTRTAQLAPGQALSFRDLGLEARPYALAVLRGAKKIGTVHVRVFAPERDGEARRAPAWARLRSPLPDTNASNDSDEESETFVTISPSDPTRIVAGYNDIDNIQKGPSVTSDGGQTWKQLTQPNSFDVRGKAAPEAGSVSGDPMSAADTLGNVWFGGLSVAKGSAPSRIYVNRIGPDGAFQPRTVGFDNLHDGQQDKPMMTIDNSASSPTWGRIYVAWDDPGSSGVNEVVVFCDTRVAGVAQPARCDDADNWTKPAKVLSTEGSYIYADLAVGPDGTVYYTYWDWSATNAIRGTVCRAADRTKCGTDGSFAAPRNIAVLQSSPGTGQVPFGCPTFSEPGGRTGPDPSVEVDTSTNRVWVAWGDLRENSGATRCEFTGQAGTPPLPTNRTWDVYAASAVGDLPGGAPGALSAAVGTQVSTDVGTVPAGIDNNDDFFPWLAVDQSTGRAWVDWYTTSGDTTRRTTAFVVAPLQPGAGTKPTAGAPVTVSTGRSDYSAGTTACCVFGNDYGDYTGLDAAAGRVVAVWTSRADATDDGDAHVAVLQP